MRRQRDTSTSLSGLERGRREGKRHGDRIEISDISAARSRVNSMPGIRPFLHIASTEMRPLKRKANALRSKQAKGKDGDLVQCERCEGWCLGEMVFKTVAAAEGNGFVCRLCKVMENLEKQLKSEMEKTKEELEKEKTKRAEFEERVERE
nr:uncharacterized protein LOC126527536 [Dermacentor andersoni]